VASAVSWPSIAAQCPVIEAAHYGRYGVGVSTQQPHTGGGFNPPTPTDKGGPDYGRFIAAVRTLQDQARSVDAPDGVVTEAADLLDKLTTLLAPYEADEWTSPSGRRIDLPNRGNILSVPMDLHKVADDRVEGTVRFGRYHLGRNGAAHGGTIGLMFDSLLGYTAAVLSGRHAQRTAYLHVDYRAIVPVETELRAEATIRSEEGRKMFVEGAVYLGDTLLTEANALFVKLKPGQP